MVKGTLKRLTVLMPLPNKLLSRLCQSVIFAMLASGLTAMGTFSANAAIVNGCDTSGNIYPASTGVDGFGAGKGTSAEPWLVCSSDQLANMGKNGTATNGNYRLATDIDLSGISWVPVEAGDFRGVIDGNYKSILNLSVSGNLARLGLFARLGGTSGQPIIKKISFVNPSVVSSSTSVQLSVIPAAGILVGSSGGASYSEILLRDPTISGKVVGAGFVVGTTMEISGAKAFDRIRVVNGSMSSTYVDSSGTVRLGGVVGLTNGVTIKRAWVSGSIEGSALETSYVGGIVGDSRNLLTISESFSDAILDAGNATEPNIVGGIIASDLATSGNPVSNSLFAGEIRTSSSTVTGGIVGSGASSRAPTNSIVSVEVPIGATANSGPVVGSLDNTTSAASAFYDSTSNVAYDPSTELGVAKSTSDLKLLNSFPTASWSIADESSSQVANWDIDGSSTLSNNVWTNPIWQIDDGNSVPSLVWISRWPGTPSAPTSVSATSPSAGTASLSWTAPGQLGFAAASGYKIESSTNAGQNWSIEVANTNSTSTTATISSLTPGSSYLFRVSGISTLATSNPGVTSVSLLTGSIPGQPENLRAVSTSANSFRISWDQPANTGGLAITGYTLQVDKGSGFETISHTGTSADITGVTINSLWSFRVLATNVVGNSGYASFTNTPPAPYSGPVISNLSKLELQAGTPKRVTIEGHRLDTVTSAAVNGASISILERSESKLLVVLPELTEGIKDLVLISPAGKLTHQDAFNVVSATPVSAQTLSQKINAGSFKGFVAVYAKGYEGKRLSAKIGKDWVIVPSLGSNFVRVVDAAVPGRSISVRIFIDRVLVATIPVVTQ